MMPPNLVIALVEDNEDDRFFMLRALKEADIPNPVQVLRTGREAMDYLAGLGEFSDRDRYPLPFLLLLDLKLPEMNGFDILRWVRGHPSLNLLTTIVLTNSGEAKDIIRSYELGANSFLVKPSGVDKLLEMVNSLKEYWFVHNGYPPPRA